VPEFAVSDQSRGAFGEPLSLVLAVIATAIILPLSLVLGVRKRLR
jgi:hypothetical protein